MAQQVGPKKSMATTTKSDKPASRKPATTTKASAFEAELTANAVTTRESSITRPSMTFLQSLKEVIAKRSSYNDGCYADLKFKDGKHKACALDYDCPAAPGDKIKISSIRWKTFTNDDGSTFTVLTGDTI